MKTAERRGPTADPPPSPPLKGWFLFAAGFAGSFAGVFAFLLAARFIQAGLVISLLTGFLVAIAVPIAMVLLFYPRLPPPRTGK